jgi:predicted GTPase
MKTKNVLIMGAAGRDFHNFNVYYRNNPEYNVVGFTAFQIPNIAGRKYPAVLAGERYPNGIPIFEEEKLTELIKEHKVDEVVFSYSDVNFNTLMQKGSVAMAAGAHFTMLGSEPTMIKSSKPVIAVCAVRTGCGKSQTSRAIAAMLKEMGKKPAIIRHPMPYGNLEEQVCQRFATFEDLKKHKCTIEEMEEYEPHIKEGHVVYAGVDYGVILENAEKEADVILWDGGNNDTSFYKPDLYIVVTDPLRPGHEELYYPGLTNLVMADSVILNKVDSATAEMIETVKKNITKYNPDCKVIEAESPVAIEDENAIKGKKVLIVEDGPTLTHGEMKYGAGHVAAKKFGAAEIVRPEPYAVGSIKEVYKKYSHLSDILPAMGYGDTQMKELQDTINATPCDIVVIGTPIDLARHIKIDKPSVRVTYSLKEKTPTLKGMVEKTVMTEKAVK